MRDELTALLAEHFPPLGECALCGGPDAQHRMKDTILDRFIAGDTLSALAADFSIPEEAISAVLIEHIESLNAKIDQTARGRKRAKVK